MWHTSAWKARVKVTNVETVKERVTKRFKSPKEEGRRGWSDLVIKFNLVQTVTISYCVSKELREKIYSRAIRL